MTIYEELQECIDKNIIISIIYANTNNYHQIKPLELVVANKNKIYLRAININFNKERTYKIEEIRSIEKTSLKFSKEDELTRGGKYLYNMRTVELDKEYINSNNQNLEIDNDLIRYYIKALKLESLMEIKIDNKKDKVLYIDKKDCIAYSLSSSYEKILNIYENEIIEDMIKELLKYPDNTIYLGYPYIENKNFLYPIIFQKVVYDVDKKSIHIVKNSTVLNYKLFSKDLDLNEDEIENIKNEILSENINGLIEKGILSKLLNNSNLRMNSNRGFIFIERGTHQNYGLLRELKNIVIDKKVNGLIKSFFEDKVIQSEQKINKYIYNVVEVNDSQKEAIFKSYNNIEIIKGPPGTGKTQTIINLICNYVMDGKKILVASQNNKAVDNIVDKLKKDNIYMGILRLGNDTFKENALKDILNLISNINKLIEKDSKNNIEEYIGKSKEQEIKIDLIRDKINEIEKLKKSADEMIEVIEGLRRSLVEINLEKHIDNYNTTINTLNKNISIMNQISCLCEKFEIKRNNILWKTLSKFKFNYDKYRIRQIIKSLDNIELNLYRETNFDIILDVKDCVDGNIMLMEYSILKYKYNNIINRLNDLNKEKWNEKYIIEKNKKIEIDRDILKNKYNVMLSEFINNKNEVNILNEVNLLDLKRDINIFKSLLNLYPVILTTNLSISTSVPFEEVFDVVIIDEASQCNIPSILPLLIRAKSLVLVGDNKQLPPVISLDKKEDDKLIDKFRIDTKYSFKNNSIFDFYNRIIKEDAKVLLNEHFRCNPKIINISNKFFYNSKLKICTKNREGDFLGVQYCNLQGEIKKGIGGRSISNIKEVIAIREYLLLNKDYFADKTIGIITPFKEQKNKLEEMVRSLNILKENITVGTVHTFQGDERDIIIFSLVASNGCSEGTINWLNKEKNIINVAITRAIELLYVVGDLSYLSTKNGIMKDFSDYIVKYGNRSNINEEVSKEFSIYEILHKHKIELLEDNNNEIKKIMNNAEKILYDILKKVIKLNFKNLDIGIKIRVADIFNISPDKIDKYLFYYGLSAHFDFIIFDKNNNLKPIMAIELDGDTHRKNKRVIKNDIKKNNLCEIYKFPIIRISSKDKISEEYLNNIIKSKYQNQ